MRNINSTALAQVQKQYGIESIIVIEIDWPSGVPSFYGEKEHPEYGIEARILTLGSIDDVIGVGSSGNSKSISVTLSDHDGVLKNLFDFVDLHYVPCKIRQWFEGIPFANSFVLFDGYINTPISWKEGERTLDLTIMTILENREIGFSPDESYFNIVGHSLLGAAWPIIFGTVTQSPLLRIHDTPTILTARGFGIVDEKVWQTELDDLAKQAQLAHDQALSAYVAGLFASHVAATYIDGIEDDHIGLGGVDVVTNPPDDYSQYLSYNDQSNQYYQQYTNYSNEYVKIQLTISEKSREFQLHKSYLPGGAGVPILSPNVPRGVPLVIEIGEDRFNANIQGNTLYVGTFIKPPKPKATSFATYDDNTSIRTWQGEKSRQKFNWIPGGTRLKVINLPINYIISIGTSQPIAIYGQQQGAFVPIPTNLYTIQQTPFITRTGQTVFATTLTMTTPLSLVPNVYNQYLWDSDNIYADVIGPVPGRMVDILQYVIDNFSSLEYDPVSFSIARLFTDGIPMNHAIRDRRECLTYIEAIAFQGKCVCWIKDSVVYIRYQPVEPIPVDTISLGNILEKTLEIYSTNTEDVVTKYIATWKFNESQPENNELVFRYNLARYFLHEDTYNFFAFNDPGSVGWSARYWSMFKATVFKKIKFKSDISLIHLESFDAVNVNLLGLAANEVVVGIVESATYDSDNKEIDFVIWLPVRLGEMYHWRYVYPASELALYGDPSDLGIYTGNPFQFMKDPFKFLNGYPTPYNFHAIGALPPMHPIPYDIESPSDTPLTVDTFVMNALVNGLGPPGIDLNTANDYTQHEVKTLADIPLADETPALPYFGTVIGQVGEDKRVYKLAILGGNRTIKATCLQLDAESPVIPVGTPVITLKVKGVYYIQPPIWLFPDTSTP